MSTLLVLVLAILAGCIVFGLAVLAYDAWVNIPQTLRRWLDR